MCPQPRSHVGLRSALPAVHTGSLQAAVWGNATQEAPPALCGLCRCITHGHVSRRGGNSREKERGGIEVETGRCPPSAPWVRYLSVLSGGPLLPRTPCPTWCSSVAPVPPCSPSRSLTPNVSLPAVRPPTPPKTPSATSSQEAPSSASSQDDILTHPAEPSRHPVLGRNPKASFLRAALRFFLLEAASLWMLEMTNICTDQTRNYAWILGEDSQRSPGTWMLSYR